MVCRFFCCDGKIHKKRDGIKMEKCCFSLKNESESLEFAVLVSKKLQQLDGFKKGLIIYLKGDLGAGKSFFSRAFIQNFLPGEKVKSPTYTIVESYNFSTNCIYHLDLYRLCDPEELEYLAIRDLFSSDFVALIEWPQNGFPVLPASDIVFEFEYAEFGEQQGRQVLVSAQTAIGKSLLEQLS